MFKKVDRSYDDREDNKKLNLQWQQGNVTDWEGFVQLTYSLGYLVLLLGKKLILNAAGLN